MSLETLSLNLIHGQWLVLRDEEITTISTIDRIIHAIKWLFSSKEQYSNESYDKTALKVEFQEALDLANVYDLPAAQQKAAVSAAKALGIDTTYMSLNL